MYSVFVKKYSILRRTFAGHNNLAMTTTLNFHLPTTTDLAHQSKYLFPNYLTLAPLNACHAAKTKFLAVSF